MKKHFNIKKLTIFVVTMMCFLAFNSKVKAKNFECTYTISGSNISANLSENSYNLVKSAKGSELTDGDKKGYITAQKQENLIEIKYTDSGSVTITGVPRTNTKISTSTNSLSISNTFSQSFSMNFTSSDFTSKYKDGTCPNTVYTKATVDLESKSISYSVSLYQTSYYSNSYTKVDMTKYKVNTDDNERPTGCDRFGSFKKYIYIIFNLIRFGVPVIIIVLSVIDFAGVVLSGENEDMEKAKKKFITRLIVGVIILLIPYILQSILRLTHIIGSDESIYDLICYKK